jgi:cytochrome P450
MDRPLNPRAVRAFEPTIRQIADQLIESFAARGVADLAPELCDLLPAIVIGRLVGLDHDEFGSGAPHRDDAFHQHRD